MSPDMNMRAKPPEDDRRIPVAALVLGAGGLVPFFMLSVAPLFDLSAIAPWDRLIRGSLAAYAALIASFLGGIRWGLALEERDAARQAVLLAGSVLPALVAWVAMALPRPHDLTLLIALFLGLAVADVRLAMKGGIPRWFGTLRLALSVGVIGSLVLALAAETL